MSSIMLYMPQLLEGLLLTLKISLGGFFLGLSLAVLITFLWNNVPASIRLLFVLYVSFIRGLPEIMIIFLFYFGGTIVLTNLFGSYVEINGAIAGILALATVSSAYFIEILRAAFNTIPLGQSEAATSLGLSRATTFIKVIMPQIFIFAWPAIGNQWLIILKDSALVSAIGYEELLRKATIGGSAVRAQLEFYIAAAFIYIIITSLSTLLFKSSDRYMSQRR